MVCCLMAVLGRFPSFPRGMVFVGFGVIWNFLVWCWFVVIGGLVLVLGFSDLGGLRCVWRFLLILVGLRFGFRGWVDVWICSF